MKRHRRRNNLGRLRAAVALSQFGTQVSTVSIPLVAILQLNAPASAVGTLIAAQTAAFLLVGLPAGVWVDRVRRRPVLVTADLARCLLLVSIPVSALLGVLTLAQMYVVVFAVGLASVFFDVSYQSYLPRVVGRAGLSAGNAKVEASRVAAQVGAPSAGGLIVSLTSPSTAVLVDSVTYLGSAVLIGGISTTEDVPPARHDSNTWRELRAGVGFVLRHRLLRIIAVSGAAINFFAAMVLSNQILFLARTLGLPPGQIGFLMAAGPVGALAAASGAGRLLDRLGTARAVWLSGLLAWPFAVLMPLAGGGPRLLLFPLSWALVSAGVMIYNVAQVTARQLLTPEAMLGRMNATMRFFLWGALAAGAASGGFLAERAGVRAAMLLGAAGAVAGFALTLLTPLARLRDFPASEPAPAGGPLAPAGHPRPGGPPSGPEPTESGRTDE